MKIVEKKFQIISVGAAFMSDDYRIKLEKDGYELITVNTDTSGQILSYFYKLKDTVEQMDPNELNKSMTTQ